MNILKATVITASTYAFAAVDAAQHASSNSSKTQEPASAAEIFLIVTMAALGGLALLICTSNPKRMDAENRQAQTHRALIRQVVLSGPAGTKRPEERAFHKTKARDYDRAVVKHQASSRASRLTR